MVDEKNEFRTRFTKAFNVFMKNSQCRKTQLENILWWWIFHKVQRNVERIFFCLSNMHFNQTAGKKTFHEEKNLEHSERNSQASKKWSEGATVKRCDDVHLLTNHKLWFLFEWIRKILERTLNSFCCCCFQCFIFSPFWKFWSWKILKQTSRDEYSPNSLRIFHLQSFWLHS